LESHRRRGDGDVDARTVTLARRNAGARRTAPRRASCSRKGSVMDRVWSLLVCVIATAATPTPPPKPVPPARHASLPAPSPDGKQVVFCSDRDGGQTELYVADLATGL